MTKQHRALLITALASLVVLVPTSTKSPGPDSASISIKPTSAQHKLSDSVYPQVSALSQIAPKTAPAPPATSGGCGDNEYAHYIYMHESGCNLNAVNGSGCRGIGQACPGSKLPCGADYACQNAYFTQYAQKYGGWAGAYAFWVAHSWW